MEMTVEQKRALALAAARARLAQPSQMPSADIDPETGQPFDPSIPTKMARAREAERAAGAKARETTTERVMDVAGKLYDESKLAGLAPEVSPLMGLFETSGAAMASTKLAASPVATVAGKVASVATSPLRAGKQMLGELASETTKKAYQIGKEGTTAMREAWKAGKEEGLPASERGMSAIAKYFKRFYPEQNMADVEKAINMTKQEGGVWDIARKAQEAERKIATINPRSNWAFPENASLVLPETMQVQPGGLTLEAARRAGQEATWFPNALTLTNVLSKPSTFASLASPRLQANLAYGAGRTADIVKRSPRLTSSDLYNLGLLSPRIKSMYEE